MLFPNNYGLTAGQAISCSADYGFTISGGCAVDSDGRTISVNNVASTDFLLILSIDGIVTPAYQNLWCMMVYSYD